MLRFRLTLLAFAVLVGISNSLPAQVADYVGDFLPGTVNGQTRPVVAADGWDYMWNAGGVIGTAAGNYSSLPWWSGQNQYNFDGAGNLPRANPAAYVNLIGTGGHPGRGVNQGGVVDRYAIAAYTIQPGENGFLSIDNSSFSVAGGGSNGVDLRVYVNDTLMTDFIAPGAGGAIPFDMVLGTLNAGDTVYVAAGPNLTDGNDAFGLGYQLVTTADPSIALWDANGTPPENGGSGNWDTTSLVWSTSAGYVAWNNAGNMNANFGPTAGTVTLTEAITARSLSFSTGGYTIAGAGTLTLTGAGSGGPGPQTISVSSDTATISAPITGGNLTKVGGGTLVLTGNNTYLGATKIDGGVLTVNGSGAITQTDRLHNRVGGVTLNVQDSASITATNYMVLGDFSNASITVNQSGGTVTNLGTANNPGGNNVANRWGHWGGGNTTYNLSSGTLNLLNAPLYLSWDGDATLNVAGGTANIAGINMGYGGRTHNSTINLTSGTLNIGSGGITTGGTANKNINLGGGTLAASADWSSSMPMTLTGSGGRVRVDTNGHTVTLSGDLTGAGGLTKIDDGSLTLSGNTVTMNDQFYVANGTVNLNGSTVTANGGTQIADRGQDNVNPINAVLNINTGSSLTTRFIVGGNGGGSNINGTINQYDGTTVTTTGVTAENNGLRLGHYPGGNVTYNLMGGTLTIGDNRDLSAATDGTGWFNQTGGTLNVERIVVNKRGGTGGSGRVTLAGGTANIGGGGIITDSTPSKATLEYGGLGGIVRATASFSSPLDATLFGTGANTVSFDTNGNNITLSGVLGGSGGLNKIGAGTLTLNAANTYTGGTTVDGGTLSLGYASGGTGTIRGTLTVNAGGTVDYTQENTFGWAGGASVNVLNLVGGTVGGADYRNHFWNNFQLNMTGGTLNLGGTNNEFHNATITVNNAPTTAQILGVTGNAVMRLRDGTSAVFNVADGVQAVDLLVDVPITQNTGSSGITKNGAGRMEMTGISTFRGPTTVNDGVLAVNDGMLYNIGWQDALLTVNGGSVLEVGGWADGDSVGIGRVSFAAANIVMDDGTIRYTGDTTTGNPDRGFTIGAGGATLDAAGGNTWRVEQGRGFGITSTAGGTLTLAGASDGSLTMNLSGAGNLVKNGTGTWTLGGANDYTGGTTVNQGTLNLQGSNNGSSTVGTGTLVINAGGTVTANSHNVLGHGSPANIPHIVINGGTLDILEYQHVKSIEMTGGTIAQHGHFNGSGLDWGHAPRTLISHAAATSATISAKMQINQGLPVNVEDGAAADDLVISGPIVGNGELLKVGAGTLVLGNTGNSYGQTKIDAGVLKLGASGVLPDNDVHNNWGGGGTLDLNGFDEAINQLGGNFGIINSGAGTPTLTVGVNNGSGWNYGGKISGDLSIRKAGTGTQQLSGRASDYTGDTIVDAGTLVLNGANSADSLIGTSRLVINPSGTVDAYVNAFGSTYQNLIDINGGTLRSVGADSHLNAVSMTGGLMTGVEFRPHAAFTINASPDTAVIDVNRLNLFATITFNVADGAADPDLLISGQVTGGNELVKAGPGTMVLTNTANNYSQTKIDAGTLKLGASGVLPDNNVHNNWGGGGVLDLNGFDEAINRLGGNFAVLNSGAGTPELTVGVNNGSGWNYGGLISGDLSIRKTGTGWQQLTGNNTYTGGTTVDAGELRLSGPNDPASSVGLGTLTINAGGTVRALDHNVLGHTSAANIPPIVINGGSLIPNQYLHVADVEMTGGIIEAGPAGGAGLQTHASTFTTHGSTDPATVAARVQAAFGDVTFDVADGAADMDMIVSGDIHGGNDIFKTGAGTLHLTHANNTLTGTATVNDGTLLVDGTLHGDVDVQPGGTFSAGSQVGHAIVTSASSYTQTGTMLVELGGTAQGAEYDWIEVNGGAADVGGLLDIVLVDGFRPATHSTFDVLTATGGVTDSGITLNWDPTPLLPAQYWTHSIADLGAGAQALRLEVAAPEPSSAILAVLGLLGLAWFARRRKR